MGHRRHYLRGLEILCLCRRADKNLMIKITTWLLRFSAAILGFLSTGKLTISWAELLICLGMLISFLAAFVSLPYGGYAT